MRGRFPWFPLHCQPARRRGSARRQDRALVSHLSAYLHSHLAHFVFIQEVLREALPSHKKELPTLFGRLKPPLFSLLKIIIMTIMTTRAIDLPFTRVWCTFWDHISDQFNKLFRCKWRLLKIWIACSYVWEIQQKCWIDFKVIAFGLHEKLKRIS